MLNKKPINKSRKGSRVELLAKKILQAQGYWVEKKNISQWQSPDFFGWFDLLAIRGAEVRLIQIKSNLSDFYKARKDIAKFELESGFKVPLECWCYLGRSVWRQEKVLGAKWSNLNQS
jgi:hypothetical protein